ncbi:transposase [Streptomyces atriruber]|uniref:transposase n=1 Tax=Streptomyces atriruber TaxID=545121 RepID=UPI003F53F662
MCGHGASKVRRHELSDAQWRRIESMLPANGLPDGQRSDHRTVVNRLLFRARTGAPWPDLPKRYGPWHTAPGRPPRSIRWPTTGPP